MTKTSKTEQAQEQVTTGSKTSSLKAGLVLVSDALIAVRTTSQSIIAMEPKVGEAALYAVRHAKEHGDVSLADKLVKGIREIMGKGKIHPMMSTMYNELFAWFRSNSPIRWDAQGKCSIDKERGWKDKDLENAESEAFFETERAVKARDAALAAQKRTLEPMTFENVKARIYGLRKMLERVTTPNKDGEIQGFASKGDAKLAREAVDVIEDAFNEHFKIKVNNDGPISERGKRKAAASDDNKSKRVAA